MTYLDEGLNLKSIPGVGDAISKKISEMVTTGRLQFLVELQREFPQGIRTPPTVTRASLNDNDG